MSSTQGSGSKAKAPPTSPVPIGRAPEQPALESYQRVAETIGMIPSVRFKDNVVQAVVIMCTTVAGLIVSWIITQSPLGFIFGALGGLVLGVLTSGFVLMILGWVRAVKKSK